MTSTTKAELKTFSPEARQLLTFWLSLRNGLDVPSQEHLDPMGISRLLAHIWIYRYDPGLDDFVCRLAGESINLAWGGSIKGVTLRQVVGDARHSAAIARWKAIISTPHIQHGRVSEIHDGEERLVAERLVLPMSGGGQPDRVLGYSSYSFRQTDRDRVPPVWNNVVTIRCSDL
jgi:hypothetical protein